MNSSGTETREPKPPERRQPPATLPSSHPQRAAVPHWRRAPTAKQAEPGPAARRTSQAFFPAASAARRGPAAQTPLCYTHAATGTRGRAPGTARGEAGPAPGTPRRGADGGVLAAGCSLLARLTPPPSHCADGGTPTAGPENARRAHSPDRAWELSGGNLQPETLRAGGSAGRAAAGGGSPTHPVRLVLQSRPAPPGAAPAADPPTNTTAPPGSPIC